MSEELIQPTSIDELQPKMHLKGTITRTELYGAFVNLGLERDGLIHISRLSPKRIKKVTDVVKVGDEVDVWVLDVDPAQGRIALTMVEPPKVDWDEMEVGQVRSGQVVRLERYGAFVDLGAERPGLLHVKEMGQYVRDPSDVVRVGETIEVKIIKLDRRKRQIDLSMNIETHEEIEEEDEDPFLSPMEIAFREAKLQSPPSGRGRSRKSRRSNRRRSDLDEIYERTLRQG